jgi:hypothetical protein
MTQPTWDYSPIVKRLPYENSVFAAIVAVCKCGVAFSAVSTTLELCDRRIKLKYRKHARQYPVLHPIPGLIEAQAHGWTSGSGG